MVTLHKQASRCPSRAGLSWPDDWSHWPSQYPSLPSQTSRWRHNKLSPVSRSIFEMFDKILPVRNLRLPLRIGGSIRFLHLGNCSSLKMDCSNWLLNHINTKQNLMPGLVSHLTCTELKNRTKMLDKMLISRLVASSWSCYPEVVPA